MRLEGVRGGLKSGGAQGRRKRGDTPTHPHLPGLRAAKGGGRLPKGGGDPRGRGRQRCPDSG